MDSGERILRQAFSDSGKYDPVRAEQARREIAEMYDRRLNVWKVITWVMLVIDALGMAGLAALFVFSESIKTQIVCAAGFLVFFESSIMEKMFYWYLSLRYRLQRDLVELKLQIAELSAREPDGGPN